MKRCGKCHETYRVGRIAHVTEGSKIKRLRVCQKCAKGGVLVLAAEQVPACKCGKPAKLCGECATGAERRDKAADVRKAIETMRTWHAVASFDAETDDFKKGRADGLTSAIELLESGRY